MSTGVVAFVVSVTVFLVFYAWKGNAGQKSRADGFDASYYVPQVPVSAEVDSESLFERIVRPAIRNILPQTPMSAQVRARNSTKVAELLVRSGNPWNIQPEEYLGVVIFAAIVGFAAGLVFSLMHVLPAMLPSWMWVIAFAALGGFVPRVLLDGAKGRRLKEARRGLPEAVDLLVITLKSGKRLDTAMTDVYQQLPPGVVKDELGRVVADLNTQRGLTEALTDFARRAPSHEVELFAKAIIISERMGSDATETLAAQAEQAREAYEQALDAKIGKLPQTLYFPILGLMLPALFIVIMAPMFSNIATAFN